jgi:hypothetical protein
MAFFKEWFRMRYTIKIDFFEVVFTLNKNKLQGHHIEVIQNKGEILMP